VHDVFGEALFGDTALGRPVVGTVASIEAMRRDQIAGYYRRRYRPEAMVVSAAGQLDHRTVLRLVRRAFADTPGGTADGTATAQPPRTGGRPPRRPARRVATIRRPTEQANVVLGTFGLSRHDDRRYALGVLNSALGGGMSSRLFQEVRERRGLAYSVYSFTTQYAGAGAVGVSAGCHPAKVHELLAVVRDQLNDVAEHGLADAEVARGKGQVRGGMVLGLEDTGSRMSRIGKGELAYGEVVELDEMLARVDAVAPDEIRALAAELLSGPMCLAVVGPFDDDEFDLS
jgi:predicted Zn-dependent peptidase